MLFACLCHTQNAGQSIVDVMSWYQHCWRQLHIVYAI